VPADEFQYRSAGGEGMKALLMGVAVFNLLTVALVVLVGRRRRERPLKILDDAWVAAAPILVLTPSIIPVGREVSFMLYGTVFVSGLWALVRVWRRNKKGADGAVPSR
jgi:hypothetical protein